MLHSFDVVQGTLDPLHAGIKVSCSLVLCFFSWWSALPFVYAQAYAADLREMIKALTDAAPSLVRPNVCLHYKSSVNRAHPSPTKGPSQCWKVLRNPSVILIKISENLDNLDSGSGGSILLSIFRKD